MTFRLLAATLCAVVLSLSPAAAQEIGEHFSLPATDGRRIGPSELAGRPYLLFFGFTHCPDICPTALAEIASRIDELGPDADPLQVVFVTVDPTRDTPEVLGEYLAWFDPRIIGLSGSEEETAATARAFRATYRKVPQGDGAYTMDHTAALYLMDADGVFFDRIDYRAAPEAQLAALRRLLDTARD